MREGRYQCAPCAATSASPRGLATVLARKHRHDLAGEQADRSQAFLPRQIAESELPDHVIATGLVELGGEEVGHRRRRAGDALAALDHQVEGRGAGMRLRAVMPPEQMREARMPDQVGAARQRHCVGIARRDHDEAAEPELRERHRRRVHLRPDRAVAVDGETGFLRRVEAHHVEVAARRALGAVGHVHAVPDRRMRFLQRLDLHRHVAEGEPLALEIEHLVRQALEHELDRLGIDRLRLVGIGAVVLDLDRHRAAAEADLEAAAAQLVEHADFLDQPQRMVERHRPHQRTEAKPLRALRDGGQEHARRGRHAERRRMVLGEVISVETRAVIGLGNLQAILVEVGERAARPVEMIEDAEFHSRLAHSGALQ